MKILKISEAMEYFIPGWSIVSNTRELGAFGNDGEGFGTSSRAYGSKSRVSDCGFRSWQSTCLVKLISLTDKFLAYCDIFCSRGAEKYFRRGSRLNWPEGAISRESIRAVNKMDHLKVLTAALSCSSFPLISPRSIFVMPSTTIRKSSFWPQINFWCTICEMHNLVSQHVVGASRFLLITLLHGLLKFDPSERITARDALNHPFFENMSWTGVMLDRDLETLPSRSPLGSISQSVCWQTTGWVFSPLKCMLLMVRSRPCCIVVFVLL